MTEQNNVAISLSDVGKIYKIYPRPIDRLKQSFVGSRKHYFTEHQALQPLSLEITRGQTVGVIGTNGSGKSTLLQIITSTLTPTSGNINVRGRVSALLELGAGFNPEFSGHENIYLNGSILGLDKQQMDACYDEIVAFSGLEPHLLQQPVKTYSSGMYVRLAFAVAIAVEPDILIVDEALAVGDEGFQRKCFARIKALQENGATILFVSHSARTIIDLCDHAIWLDEGELLLQGKPSEVVEHYHKMLFAKEEDRAAIRDAVKQTAEMPSDVQEHAEVQAPESRHEYNPQGAMITKVRLTDMAGQETQMLQQGESYQVHYQVQCQDDLESLRCAMTIKTMTGIELAATICHGKDNILQDLKAGQVREVCFTFPCRMLKGDYFINVGLVQEVFGTVKFIHRIVDALHVKVMPAEAKRDGTVEPLGLVDIGALCDVR